MFSGYENLDYADLIILISQFPYKYPSDKELLQRTFEGMGALIDRQLQVESNNSDWIISENPMEIDDENYTSKFIAGIWWDKKRGITVDQLEIVDYLKKNKLPYFEHHHHKTDITKNYNEYFNLNEEFYKKHLKEIVKKARDYSNLGNGYASKFRKTIMRTARKFKADWLKQNETQK